MGEVGKSGGGTEASISCFVLDYGRPDLANGFSKKHKSKKIPDNNKKKNNLKNTAENTT